MREPTLLGRRSLDALPTVGVMLLWAVVCGTWAHTEARPKPRSDFPRAKPAAEAPEAKFFSVMEAALDAIDHNAPPAEARRLAQAAADLAWLVPGSGKPAIHHRAVLLAGETLNWAAGDDRDRAWMAELRALPYLRVRLAALKADCEALRAKEREWAAGRATPRAERQGTAERGR